MLRMTRWILTAVLAGLTVRADAMPQLAHVDPGPESPVVPVDIPVTPEAAKVHLALSQPIDMPFGSGTPLRDVLESIRRATAGEAFPDGIPIYVDPIGLIEAGQTLQSPVTIEITGIPLSEGLCLILEQLDLISYIHADGVLVVIAEKRYWYDPAQSNLELLNELQNLRRDVRARTSEGHPLGGGQINGTVISDFREGPSEVRAFLDATEPVDPDRSYVAVPVTPGAAAIHSALGERVDMPFGEVTPLGEVLDHIRRATSGDRFPDGIPIYVDPIGLHEADQTLESPVRIDLRGIPLATTLGLTLDQLGLVDSVRGDGYLVITAKDGTDPVPAPVDQAIFERFADLAGEILSAPRTVAVPAGIRTGPAEDEELVSELRALREEVGRLRRALEDREEE